MSSSLDSVLEDIAGAGDAGLSFAKIRDKVLGKSAGKDKGREAELRNRLAFLVQDRKIRGPFKARASQLYFAAGRGPSIDTASGVVARLVLESGVKLLSKLALEKKVTGLNKRYFADAVADAVSKRAIMELSVGRSKCYLHRQVAAERLGLEVESATEAATSEAPRDVPLNFRDLQQVYRRMRAEQGGFAAVKIFDLIKASNAPKATVHQLLIDEAKAGRVTLQPSNSVDLPRDVIDAGIRLHNFPEPYITAILMDDK